MQFSLCRWCVAWDKQSRRLPISQGQTVEEGEEKGRFSQFTIYAIRLFISRACQCESINFQKCRELQPCGRMAGDVTDASSLSPCSRLLLCSCEPQPRALEWRWRGMLQDWIGRISPLVEEGCARTELFLLFLSN